MKKNFSIITIFLLLSSLFLYFPTQSVVASDIGIGEVGIKNRWGIGYKIYGKDTVPLIAFDRDQEEVTDSNSYKHPTDNKYVLDRNTVNIYVKSISDLYIVYDLYYGPNDENRIDLDGYFGNPDQFFIDITSGDDIFRDSVPDIYNKKTFNFTDRNLNHGFFVNVFDGLANNSNKQFIFNFESMIKEENKNQLFFEFSMMVQNYDQIINIGDDSKRRIEIDIKVIVDNEIPQFYLPFFSINSDKPIDNSNIIYTRNDYVFRTYDTVNGNKNQISRYSCKKDGVSCLNVPSMPQSFILTGFVPEIRLSENGTYDLEIEDLAGNINKLKVVVDKNAPTILSFIENETGRVVVNNGAYSKGITLTIMDNSVVNEVTIEYKYNDVRQTDIVLISNLNTLDDIFVNYGKYEILSIKDFLGNQTLFSNNSQSIIFFIDNLGPFYDGNVKLYHPDNIIYNTDNVRLKFFDDEFGGIFTITYYHIIDGIEIVKSLRNKDIFGYYLFSEDAHHKVVIKDKALNELVIEFIIDKTAPNVEGHLNQNIIYLDRTSKIKFTDSISGIKLKDSTVKFNNQTQPTTLLSTDYEITTEGKYTFNLKDIAGNQAELIVYLDFTKPSLTTQSIINNSVNDYYNQVPLIIYSDGEFGSGIKSYFRFINQQWVEVQKRDFDSFLNDIASGSYTFKVVDFMNFESDILTINFDQTKPVLNSDVFIIEELNYFNTFDLVFTVFDDYSGIKEIKIYEFDYLENKYVLKHSNETTIDSFNTLMIEEKEGKYKIELIDNANNINIYEFYFDKQAPTLLNINNESFITNWTDNFNIYFKDENSGINKIEVAYENEPYVRFVSFLALLQNGQYRFKVYDNAGNLSEFTLFYDYVNPTIDGIIPNSTTKDNVTLVFDDNYSGFNYAIIKLNDEVIETQFTDSKYKVIFDGSYDIEVFDKAGRSTSITFVYDTIPPLLETDIELIIPDDYIFNFIGTEEVEIKNVSEISSTIQKVTYKLNSKDKDYVFPMVLGKGIHYFEFEDTAGNVSKYTFLIDINDFPYLIIDDAKIEAEIIYINKITQFTADDEISGIKSVIVDGQVQVSNSFSVSQNGTYVITLIDNSDLEKEYIIMYDDIEPVFEITLINSVLKTSKFRVNDFESGISKVEYRKDLDSEWSMYTLNNKNEGFILENGQYYFRAIDNSGNIKEVSFLAEIEYPNVVFNGILYSKEDNIYVFTSPVNLDFSQITEIFEVVYFDAQSLDEITIENLVISEDGEYLISVTNNFNNTSVYKVIIDQTPIYVETLENTFLKESYELKFGNDFNEISIFKVFYCENFSDDLCEDVSKEYIIDKSISFSLEGKYVIEVYDFYGNKSSTNFTIDKTSPILTLVGQQNIVLEYLDEYVEFGANARDNFDTDLTINMSGLVNSSVLGTYVITYQVVDKSGNEAVTIIRTVEVKDLTVPLIQLNGEASIVLEAGSLYIELGAKVTDNYDQDTVAEISGDTIDTSKLGSYIVTYNYIDSNNNIAETKTREVTVVDTINPTIFIVNENTNTSTEVFNQSIFINHSFRIDARDNGTGIQTLTINGNIYKDTPIFLSGSYLIEAVDFANNKTTLTVLLDMEKPSISINDEIRFSLGTLTVFGVNKISCFDALSEVQCFVNDILFEQNEFMLYIPGLYKIKAMDSLGNESTIQIQIRLPFKNVKSLFWYEFDNYKFKQVSEILEYIKVTSKYEYQITNKYSFTDLTILRYDIRENPSDKTSKLEFYLITYENKNYAFLTEKKLDEVLTNLIIQDAEEKFYHNLNKNFYEFGNDFYINVLSDISQLNGTYLEIKNMDGITLFEGLFNDNFQLSELRYQIILKDEKFKDNETYDFYLTFIQEQQVTFKINNLDDETETLISNEQKPSQFKQNIEIIVGDYPFDITVEIFDYNIYDQIKNNIRESSRYQVTSGTALTIGNSGSSDIMLFNNKTYVITIYYIDNETNEVISKTVELDLIDPNIPSFVFEKKEVVSPTPAITIVIKINEETLNLYYLNEVHVEYCKEKDCESPVITILDIIVKNGEMIINQNDYEEEGYYRVVARDSLNNTQIYTFNISDGSSISNVIWAILAVVGILLFAGALCFYWEPIKEKFCKK